MIYVMANDTPHKLDPPVWLMMGKYRPIRTPHRPLARGLLIDDQIFNLEGKEPLGDYPVAKIITTAEYLEAIWRMEPDDDPELTDEEALAIILGETL